jgi:hypothetical protein
MTTTTDTPAAEVHVQRGHGSKIHLAFTNQGRIIGTYCATDTLAGGRADLSLRRVYAEVTCKRCLAHMPAKASEQANTTEHTYRSEADAHAARRELINQGLSVSLIAFDPARNVHAFDAHDVFGDQVGAVARRARQRATTETAEPRCQACLDHPGWAHGDLSRRREPRDVCRACLGSGVHDPERFARETAAAPRLHLAAPRSEFTVCGLIAAEQDTTVMPERTTCTNCQHEVAVDPRGIAAEMRLATPMGAEDREHYDALRDSIPTDLAEVLD